jgi:serine/threonine-protein kinase
MCFHEAMQGPDSEVLQSWKDVSRYLNSDIRTLQRWERTRGLPIRRMPGGTKPRVYAIKSELDRWRRSGGLHIASEAFAGDPAPSPSVAVLPFLSLNSDREDQYFADGLADDIITSLSRLPLLRVIARTSSFAFRDKEQDVREVGRRLKVRAVLEGSVRRSGSRIRVTAQLVDTADGGHLWSERFDRQLSDVFAVQDEIAGAIVDALRVTLARPVSRAAPPTANADAYHLWVKARYHTLRQTPSEVLRSRELFERAIAIDPAFARAHLGLAESWWEGACFGIDRPRDAVAIGRQSVLKALELDGTLGEAHSMLGIYLGVHDFDWDAAERAFRRALELSPGSSDVRTRYAAWLLEPTLRLDEARHQLDLAVKDNPLSAFVRGCLGHHLIFRREFHLAAEELELAVELEPTYWTAQNYRSAAYGLQGRFDKTGAILEKLLESAPDSPLVVGCCAGCRALLGDQEGSRRLRAQLLERTAGYVPPLAVAWIHLVIGEPDPCLDWLEKAVEERDPLIVEFRPKPVYDGLRCHPRFQALLSTMHLAD